MTKDELRRQLQRQFKNHVKSNPDAVTLYAAELEPLDSHGRKSQAFVTKFLRKL
ncbi:hypothetical protein [Pseudomonas spelaei]|uniref:hypothetical protein n=1 Tax=Pseudomonas spelaei TaxID=1055469 RepID=UPI001FEB3BC9|nr:hypothetical protein [Pseudomonas spelaei]